MSTDKPDPSIPPAGAPIASRLKKVPFEPGMLSATMVQGFNCGPDLWAKPVTAWLKAERGHGGAIDDMELRGTRVFLYLNDAADLVGIGSIGESDVRWPNPKKSNRVECSIIPMIGVDARHQRRGYGEEIMRGLIHEARLDERKRSVVTLFADVENPCVTGLYYRLGFRPHGKPRLEPDSGRPHICMAAELTTMQTG